VEETSPRLLHFDPNIDPVAPRHAATVVVLRDGDGGLEVFCVLRSARSSFLGGAVVFPGGKLEPEDASARWADLATAPADRVEVFAGGIPARALAVAACRETLEEGRIVPLAPALPPGEESDLRRELAAGVGFADALERRGLRLDLAALVPWGRWVTPEAESRRYDARFFLLALPPGQIGRHDDHETTMSFWAPPAVMLDRFAKGEVLLAPPTLRTLELLAGTATVEEAKALAAAQSLLPICPQFVMADAPSLDGAASGPQPRAPAAPYLALPGDPSHPIREPRIAGPTRFVLRDGRFVSEPPPGGGPPPQPSLP
jgi:8-oxo-dGTP pyrophosphatase MutT (NUDIX family)